MLTNPSIREIVEQPQYRGVWAEWCSKMGPTSRELTKITASLSYPSVNTTQGEPGDPLTFTDYSLCARDTLCSAPCQHLCYQSSQELQEIRSPLCFISTGRFSLLSRIQLKKKKMVERGFKSREFESRDKNL